MQRRMKSSTTSETATSMCSEFPEIEPEEREVRSPAERPPGGPEALAENSSKAVDQCDTNSVTEFHDPVRSFAVF